MEVYGVSVGKCVKAWEEVWGSVGACREVRERCGKVCWGR